MTLHSSSAGLTGGKPVLYYNKWTGYEANSEEFGKLFRAATAKEIRALKSGDTVWFDEDPIYHHGKVYGYVPKFVVRVEGNRIHFEGGMCTMEHAERRIFFVSDADALTAFLKKYPLATVIHPLWR